MGCVRIFESNWTQIAANKSVSSENAIYPETDLYDPRRKKTWRSNGYWEVVSGDNTITFRETIGVDLIATVTAGQYTDTTSFLAAIKTSLDTAGASTYTVSVHSDGRLKIISDGAGGGGIFQIMAISDPDFLTLMGYDTSTNKTGALTYIADTIRIHTSEWIEWDLGIPSTPRAFALISDRNKPLVVSPSAVIKLQGNWTNSWATPLVDIVIPFKDFILAYEDDAGFYTSGLRYWRFYIEDKNNPYQYVEFGAVYLGDFFESSRGGAVFPLDNDFVDRSQVVFSEGGQTFAQKKPKTQIFGLQWEGLTKADLEAYDRIFHDVGLHDYFFVSFDPDEAYTTDSETMVRYCKFDSAPSARLVAPNNWSMQWTLREEL